MKYLRIEFTLGLKCEAYQELTEDGEMVTRYLDLDGKELSLPDVTESKVVNPEYETPSWAAKG